MGVDELEQSGVNLGAPRPLGKALVLIAGAHEIPVEVAG
jgi:hypothetical protein